MSKTFADMNFKPKEPNRYRTIPIEGSNKTSPKNVP